MRMCTCVCVCVCVCGRNELEVDSYALHWQIHRYIYIYIYISSFHTMPVLCTQADANTHRQTIWGWRTDGAKSGYCPVTFCVLGGREKKGRTEEKKGAVRLTQHRLKGFLGCSRCDFPRKVDPVSNIFGKYECFLHSGNRHWMHANMPLDKLMVFTTYADGDGPSTEEDWSWGEKEKEKKE